LSLPPSGKKAFSSFDKSKTKKDKSVSVLDGSVERGEREKREQIQQESPIQQRMRAIRSKQRRQQDLLLSDEEDDEDDDKALILHLLRLRR
jgi:predicted alpha/beta superfamily hydrolase